MWQSVQNDECLNIVDNYNSYTYKRSNYSITSILDEIMSWDEIQEVFLTEKRHKQK